jgi:hypothetical protein
VVRSVCECPQSFPSLARPRGAMRIRQALEQAQGAVRVSNIYLPGRLNPITKPRNGPWHIPGQTSSLPATRRVGGHPSLSQPTARAPWALPLPPSAGHRLPAGFHPTALRSVRMADPTQSLPPNLSANLSAPANPASRSRTRQQPPGSLRRPRRRLRILNGSAAVPTCLVYQVCPQPQPLSPCSGRLRFWPPASPDPPRMC